MTAWGSTVEVSLKVVIVQFDVSQGCVRAPFLIGLCQADGSLTGLMNAHRNPIVNKSAKAAEEF